MANDGVNEPVNHPENMGRRRFLTATTAVVGAVGAGFVAVPFIKSWNPSARAKLAGAPVTADISGLQGVLENDPRPSYQHDPERVYGMEFSGLEVHFVVDGAVLPVTGITRR